MPASLFNFEKPPRLEYDNPYLALCVMASEHGYTLGFGGVTLMMDLVLFRQASAEAGTWKIYRHNGLPGTRWRLEFETHDEGKALDRYEWLFNTRWRQGGIKLEDPKGKLLRHNYAPPMRWKMPARV